MQSLFRCSRFLIGWLAAAVLLLCVGHSVQASIELRGVLTELAEDLSKLLTGQNKSDIAIGQFTGPANFPTSGGAGIVQTLTEELQKKNIQVKTRAELGVKGSYKLAELPAENEDDARLGRKVLAIELEVVVEDAFSKPLGNFTFKRLIRGEATITQLIGPTAALPPDGTEIDRDQVLRRAVIDPPKPAVQGTIIRSKPDSPYALEILIADQPRRLENKDGLPFVAIRRNEKYAVRFINETEYEAAVRLEIDGLSMFIFSELRQPALLNGKANPRKGEPLYTTVIMPPKKNGKAGTIVIRGWHVNNKVTDEFLVTEYAKSAPGSLNQVTNIGTITATFQAAWEDGTRPPPGEPGKRRGGTGDATGRGDRIGEVYQEVVRNLGIIRDTISVRYTKP